MTVSLDDFKYMNDILQAECSAEAAAKLLDLAAGYLERREVMPKLLADFIAEAFRATVRVDHNQRKTTLAAWLKLTALNRRHKYTKYTKSHVCSGYARYAAALDWSETQMIAKMAQTFDVSKTQARTWWKEWKEENPKSIAAAERQGADYKTWKAENPDPIEKN